jgi:hypothetical protein
MSDDSDSDLGGKHRKKRFFKTQSVNPAGEWTSAGAATGGALARRPVALPHYSLLARCCSPCRPLAAGPRWTKAEDETLDSAVQEIGEDYKRISRQYFGGKRTEFQCRHRYTKVLAAGLRKGPWTPEEDAVITSALEELHGEQPDWQEIAERIPGRVGEDRVMACKCAGKEERPPYRTLTLTSSCFIHRSKTSARALAEPS